MANLASIIILFLTYVYLICQGNDISVCKPSDYDPFISSYSKPKKYIERIELTTVEKNEWINECFHWGAIQSWTSVRKYMAKSIHKNGTILDLSACNGILLYSLQEWIPHKLIPYGLDIDSMILHAEKLWPSLTGKKHFVQMNCLDYIFDTRIVNGWPQKFDFIHFNYLFGLEHYPQILVHGLIKPLYENHLKQNGRLLVSFYLSRNYGSRIIDHFGRIMANFPSNNQLLYKTQARRYLQETFRQKRTGYLTPNASDRFERYETVWIEKD
eukprot:191044_1